MNGYLGKKPATKDPRDITFGSLKAADGLVLPQPPPTFGHGSIYQDGEDPRHDWDMNGNGPDDTVHPGFQGAGDCAFACAGHIVREINKVQGHLIEITGKESIGDYSAVTGYVVDDNSTDQGTDMRDLMKYWQKVGMLDASGNRHKIGAYVSITPTDPVELWEACYLFSAVAIGFTFQQAQDDQFDSGTWDYVPGSPDIGGHAVPAFDEPQPDRDRLLGQAPLVHHGALRAPERRELGFRHDRGAAQRQDRARHGSDAAHGCAQLAQVAGGTRRGRRPYSATLVRSPTAGAAANTPPAPSRASAPQRCHDP